GYYQDYRSVKSVNMLDNIKLTALKSVPPHVLSAATHLSDKFNIYPNPVSNVVTITNAANFMVNEVDIVDINGKVISTHLLNNEKEINLNVEHLAAGTYMLHIQTNQGVAVKKIIKK